MSVGGYDAFVEDLARQAFSEVYDVVTRSIEYAFNLEYLDQTTKRTLCAKCIIYGFTIGIDDVRSEFPGGRSLADVLADVVMIVHAVVPPVPFRNVPQCIAVELFQKCLLIQLDPALIDLLDETISKGYARGFRGHLTYLLEALKND